MPLGQRALDPKTPYLVYEFSYNGKVFYVGHAHGAIRHTQRWSWVKNLLRHEDAGTLTPAKAAALKQKSNSVIAALIRSGLSEHKVDVPRRGFGKSWAEVEETKRILERVSDRKSVV